MPSSQLPVYRSRSHGTSPTGTNKPPRIDSRTNYGKQRGQELVDYTGRYVKAPLAEDQNLYDRENTYNRNLWFNLQGILDEETAEQKTNMLEEIKEGSLYQKLMSFLNTYGDQEIRNELNQFIGIKTQLAKITSIIEAKQSGRYIVDYNPSNVYAHVTAVAGVKLESNGYYITSETSKFVNLNGDSWHTELLKKKASDFVNSYNFHEHKYEPSKSKGTVLDVLVKESAETTYVDALIEIKDPEMKDAVRKGSLDSVSIGCVYSFVTCTQCGEQFKPEDRRCEHLSSNLRGKFIDAKGASRVISELTGAIDQPDSVKFYEISWVKNPAFCGAVLWDFVKLGASYTDKMDSYFRTYTPYIVRYLRSRSMYDRIFYLYMAFMAVAYMNKGPVYAMLKAIVPLQYNRFLARSYYEDYFKRQGLGAKEIDYLSSLVEEFGRISY